MAAGFCVQVRLPEALATVPGQTVLVTRPIASLDDLLRELDRKANQERYPHLTYPELYLMENGYCEFFKQFPTFCSPQCYVRMDDERFKDRLKGNLQMSKSFSKKKRRPSLVSSELLENL